jgi:hypothetical protein
MSRRSDKAAARLLLTGQRAPPWSRYLWAIVVAVLAAVAAIAIWVAVAGHEEAATEPKREAPAKAASRIGTNSSGEPTITLTAAIRQQNGIETTALQAAPYQDQVRAYATVLELGSLTTLGNNVASAKAQLDIAQAKLAASKAAFNRAQTLYRNQQNVSQAELQVAEAAFRTDQAGVAAAEAQLQSVAATAVQDWGPVLGKEVAGSGPLVAQLIGRQAFLLQVSLPSGVSLKEPPSAAAIQLATGARLPIRFVSVAPRTDPKIQGVSFLYMVPAESGVLPGMDVLAFLPNGSSVDGVVIPSSAIVWWQGRAWAYVRGGPESFVRRQISTDLPAPDGSGGYIARNMPAEAVLVTSGAQSLLSEEFRAQIDVSD